MELENINVVDAATPAKRGKSLPSIPAASDKSFKNGGRRGSILSNGSKVSGDAPMQPIINKMKPLPRLNPNSRRSHNVKLPKLEPTMNRSKSQPLLTLQQQAAEARARRDRMAPR